MVEFDFLLDPLKEYLRARFHIIHKQALASKIPVPLRPPIVLKDVSAGFGQPAHSMNPAPQFRQ